MAIVVRTEDWEHNAVWIKYMDGAGGTNDSGYAMITNLVLLSEAPEKS
jgi:hypothetical protein